MELNKQEIRTEAKETLRNYILHTFPNYSPAQIEAEINKMISAYAYVSATLRARHGQPF